MALTTPNTVVKNTEVEETTQAAAQQVEETTQAASAPEAEIPEITKAAVEEAVQHDAPSRVSAPKQASSQVAASRSGSPAVSSGSSIEQNMAELGMEGLSIGGMSFDRIKLPNEGIFQFGPDEEELGKEFNAVIQSTRAIYIVRQSDDDDAENYYSYQADGSLDTNGVSKEATLQEWAEDGFDAPIIKRYLEVMVQMYEIDEEGNEGSRHGLLAMLSIPPASLQRISGYIMQLTQMRKLHPSAAVTTFQVGTKVKRNANAFFPWTAKFHSEL